MPKTYTCGACHEVFEEEDEWTDNDAAAEAKQLFNIDNIRSPTVSVICDDCFQKLPLPH